MHWWLPQQGSTFAGPIDGLFIAILIITGIAFVLVEAGLIWFIVKYRGPGRKAFYTHGNTPAGGIWTTIPAVTKVAPGPGLQQSWAGSERGCSQLCGLGHYRMRAQVFVHTPEEYDTWMKQAAQAAKQ